jgi:hypothetical protein
MLDEAYAQSLSAPVRLHHSFVAAVTIGITSLFPLAYRLSIKGTSILLFPLLFFVWEAPRTKPEHIAGSLTAKALFGGACALVLTFVGGILRRATGTDWGLLKGYTFLVEAASKSKTAALFFPADRLPSWQIFVLLAAGVVFAGFLYADRLKVRGYTDNQKRVLEAAYYVLGATVACTIFALIFAASTGIRTN